jgi:hypothetical protein
LNLTKYFYQIKINKKTFSFSCATSATEYPVFSFHFERMSHFGDRIKQQTGIFYLGPDVINKIRPFFPNIRAARRNLRYAQS